ncbi:MAG TPA: hypothetical protein PKH32_10550, partial [Verrucomicrobiota bacterium]|nr:hypothetical protein [Verrucomicrobiota bacterium]
AVLHGASLKLLIFSVLLAEAVLPLGAMPAWAAAAALAGAVLAIAIGVGLVESFLARFAFRRVPLLLTTAFLLCLFALLTAWKGSEFGVTESSVAERGAPAAEPFFGWRP